MDRTIGTPGGNRPDLARFDPPSRNEAEGGHVDLDRRSLMPGEPAGLELTRFRGHFSILALREVHDAPQSPCICAGIPAEVDRAGARRSVPNAKPTMLRMRSQIRGQVVSVNNFSAVKAMPGGRPVESHAESDRCRHRRHRERLPLRHLRPDPGRDQGGSREDVVAGPCARAARSR